jgi:glutathionyl-hydroquinone reductase
VNPLASGGKTGVERVGALQRPTAVFRNWYSGTSRKTAPVLSDKASHLTISNESSEILCAREVAR